MKIAYCMACARPIQKINDTHYHCPACGQDFWNNPSATAGVVIVKDDKILLAKRGVEPNKGKFDLPGGFIEFAEDPVHAAKREIEEETGMSVENLELLAAYPTIYEENDSTVDLIFLARSWQGTPRPDDDVADLVWQSRSFLDTPGFCSPYPGFHALLESRLEGGS